MEMEIASRWKEGFYVAALFLVHFLLSLVVNTLIRTVRISRDVPHSWETLYQERIRTRLPLPDPNETLEFSKQSKTSIEAVNSFFRQRKQMDRVRIKTKRMVESIWSCLLLSSSALFSIQLSFPHHLHLFLLHLTLFQTMPKREFFLVSGEYGLRLLVLLVCSPFSSVLLCVSHDSVDAFFELTKFVDVAGFTRKSLSVNRFLFACFVLLWVGIKLGYFYSHAVHVEGVDRLVLVQAGFDAIHTRTLYQVIKGSFWDYAIERRDSDLSSAGYSSLGDYDSDNSLSSNLKEM